jgi:hypothetical protein
MPFREEDEAVELVNRSPYGLANSVWSNDLNRANRVAESLVAGNSWINAHNLFAHGVPYAWLQLERHWRRGPRAGDALGLSTPSIHPATIALRKKSAFDIRLASLSFEHERETSQRHTGDGVGRSCRRRDRHEPDSRELAQDTLGANPGTWLRSKIGKQSPQSYAWLRWKDWN